MNIFVESLGLLAAIFVIIALGRKDVRMLRKLNLIGSSLYVIYGFLLQSPSLILLNTVAIIVNAKQLKGGA